MPNMDITSIKHEFIDDAANSHPTRAADSDRNHTHSSTESSTSLTPGRIGTELPDVAMRTALARWRVHCTNSDHTTSKIPGHTHT